MSETASRAIKLFGTEEPPAETRLLRAGPLTAELDAGNLRYICYDGREAIRAISYVVRNQFWGTFNPEISDLTVEETEGRFAVGYRATCSDGSQSFSYRASITGSADGSLRFEGVGTPETDFLTNRTGFVVLHGVEGIAGHPVTVEHVDGRVVETSFPEVIDPKQPIMDIRALTHEVAPGLKAVCTMLGDTFEMEDQRNWTDASYKTYVRPLGLPHPYRLPAGETVEQAVELRFEGSASAGAFGGAGGSVTVALGAAEGQVPAFAMGLEPQHAAAVAAHGEALASLAPAFLSCYFDARSDGAEAMAGFAAAGRQLGVPLALEVAVAGEDPAAELAAVAAQAGEAGAEFASVAVTPAEDLSFVMPGTVFPDDSPFRRLFAAVRAAFPEAAVGGGTFVYFTELNRKPPPFDALDFVCHGTCAIVHAADDRSVTESVEALPYVVGSCRAMFGDRRYRIGPGTIGSRPAPFGGPTSPNPESRRVAMCRNDPRQRGLLGAAWHLGYAARVAEGGADEAILGAPLGEFGLVHHALDYPQPWFDDNGGVYPAYHVMRGIYAASGAPRRATRVSAPREVQALAYEQGGGLCLWLANLMGEPRTVALAGFDAAAARVARIDEAGFEALAGDPAVLDDPGAPLRAETVALGPYETLRLTL